MDISIAAPAATEPTEDRSAAADTCSLEDNIKLCEMDADHKEITKRNEKEVVAVAPSPPDAAMAITTLEEDQEQRKRQILEYTRDSGMDSMLHDLEMNQWMKTTSDSSKPQRENDTNAALPSPPRLARGTMRRPMSVPGAFPSTPSGDMIHSQISVEDPTETEMSHETTVPEDTDDNLAVIGGAVLVSPEEDPDQHEQQDEAARMQVLEGTLMQDPTRTPSTANAKYIWGVVGLVTLAGVAIVLGLVLGGSSSSSSSSGNGGERSNAMAYFGPFHDTLSEAFTSQLDVISSPIYQANKWMALDPHLHVYTERRQFQRFFLALIYYHTNGDDWFQNQGWLSYQVSECEWFSQTSEDELLERPRCDDNGNLLVLALASNNLTGVLPELISYFRDPPLPELRALDIAHNNVAGVMPVLMLKHSDFYVISNNSFDALPVVPAEVAGLARLRVYKIDSNKLNMTFQGYTFPLMTSLERYNATGNYIDGIISKQISFCKDLTYVGMGHNFFDSTLPTQLGLLHRLQELDVSGNALLGGSIPSELGVLRNLSRVDLTETNLTGKVPEELCTRVREGTLQVFANCSQVQCCQIQ